MMKKANDYLMIGDYFRKAVCMGINHIMAMFNDPQFENSSMLWRFQALGCED